MFKNRKEAAEKLARALENYRQQHVLVLGIPRGGVEIACYVAKYLHADMSLVVARKLGYPFSPETAFGAVAEDGSIFLSRKAKQELSPEEIQQVMEEEKQQIRQRIATLRRGKPLPCLKGRNVIIVDDGIATGATLFATLELCKHKKPKKIVVAAPVSSKSMKTLLQLKVDEVVILETPTPFYSVSQVYLHFNNLTDEEVLAFMHAWEAEQK